MADMSALPRSEISFRRSGSSGLVWDDKFLSGELKQVKAGSTGDDQEQEKQRGPQSYRTVQITPSLVDPPSPKAGCCAIFGKPANSKTSKTAKNNRKKPNTRK